MKDLLFLKDLLQVLHSDRHYGDGRNLSAAARKLGLSSAERGTDLEPLFHALAVHIMDQRGESEPFLAEPFIGPPAVVAFLKEKGLPAPAALQPDGATREGGKAIDPERFEQYFDTVCRNCGTVTDPLGTSYRTPIGRLVFLTFLETRRTLGINATARYVLEHLKNFDSENIVTSVSEDAVTWRADASKEKLTSIQTISRLILAFYREIESIL
jgi:hypothetical protein